MILDLFSGAGIGASGFDPHFNIVEAIDIEKDCCLSYKKNHHETKVKQKDVRNVNFTKNDYQGVIGLLATPPCQSFSELNNKRDPMDERGTLVYEFLRAIDEIQPEFALFENVYSIPRLFKEQLVHYLEKRKYKVVSRTVNASDYGSVQKRRRWLITLTKKRHIFPQPVPVTTVAKNILLDANIEADISLRPETLANIQTIPSGKWTSLPGRHYKGYFVVDPEKLLPAVVNPTKLRYIHPSRTRYLTFRECLSAFGVPDYALLGSKSSIGQQIANGFPKKLAEAFALSFKNYLEKLK